MCRSSCTAATSPTQLGCRERRRLGPCNITSCGEAATLAHGCNGGKKIMAVCIIKHTMAIIHLLTDANSIQIITMLSSLG
uniref:Uncharacterized protein n=1 Tax=Triticum urartu TaxID=4572 RepID=A0A8R7V474_TRIUA